MHASQETGGKRVKTPEERIDTIEHMAEEPSISWRDQVLIYVLCELARQLARIAATYEFELGIESELSPKAEGSDGVVAGES